MFRLLLLLALVPAHAYVASRAPATRAAQSVRMDALVEAALEKVRAPGEGDPFGDDNAPVSKISVAARLPVDGSRPDLGLLPRGLDAGYIELDDEPWHATCRTNVAAVTKKSAEAAMTSALPFVAAEDALAEAMFGVATAGDIDTAIKKCIKAGGRPGSPAIVAAAKLKAEFAQADTDGKPRPKPPAKKDAKAGGAGWSNQGENRQVAKTHDNSV